MTSDASNVQAESRARLLRSALTSGSLEWLPVDGESMGAAIRGGSRVRVHPRERPAFGEVWAFVSPVDHVVVHRCIGRRGARFRFRGDASGEDTPVAPAQLIGRATEVDDGQMVTPIPRWRGIATALRRRARSDLGIVRRGLVRRLRALRSG